MKIMIFLEGTTFYTKPILFLFSKHGYMPIGNAVQLINSLHDKGHEIYLCSYVCSTRRNFIKSVVDYYGMKYTDILCRQKGEQYSDLVEHLRPHILIEDDCKSIGGLRHCCITNVDVKIKSSIRSIIVPEFTGIDNIQID